MNEEHVVLVDDTDTAIGICEKLEAHRRGLLHRAFSIFITRSCSSRLEILLQRRNTNKYHCGGLWTNSCCSHPRQNETVLEAGERRLIEELGFTTKLRSVGHFIYLASFENGLTEHEFDHVLVGEYDATFQFNPDEVESIKWLTIGELDHFYSEQPTLFTPWFKEAFGFFKKYMHNSIL